MIRQNRERSRRVMSPSIRFIVTTLLLAALFVPEALPGGHRCACGMAVGCCCQLKAATMKMGDHCAMRRSSRPCGLRTGTDANAVLQPTGREGWTGPELRTGPRPALAAVGLAPVPGEPMRLSLAPDPPTPPPRLVRTV